MVPLKKTNVIIKTTLRKNKTLKVTVVSCLTSVLQVLPVNDPPKGANDL